MMIERDGEKGHVEECVQQIFQQSFNRVDKLEALDICLSNMIQ